MTDEPHVGELRWQGEPQNSPVELWDGKQWVLVGCSTPTDEELKALYWEAFKNAAPCGAGQSWLAGLRAVARWDRPAIEPVPVAERLPGPEDCDKRVQVWAWRTYDPADDDCGEFWALIPSRWLEQAPELYSHWLPHHALPVPQQEAE